VAEPLLDLNPKCSLEQASPSAAPPVVITGQFVCAVRECTAVYWPRPGSRWRGNPGYPQTGRVSAVSGVFLSLRPLLSPRWGLLAKRTAHAVGGGKEEWEQRSPRSSLPSGQNPWREAC